MVFSIDDQGVHGHLIRQIGNLPDSFYKLPHLWVVTTKVPNFFDVDHDKLYSFDCIKDKSTDLNRFRNHSISGTLTSFFSDRGNFSQLVDFLDN